MTSEMLTKTKECAKTVAVEVLSGDRAQRRQELEERARRGLADMLSALSLLREEEHWKDVRGDDGSQTYGSFEEYSQVVLGLAKSESHNKALAGDVLRSLSGVPDEQVPASASALAALNQVPEDERKDFLQDLADRGQKPTAKAIKGVLQSEPHEPLQQFKPACDPATIAQGLREGRIVPTDVDKPQEPAETEIDCLLRALEADQPKWGKVRKEGASDEHLRNCIADAFGIFKGSSHPSNWCCKGGKNPRFWLNAAAGCRPHLQGAALLQKVREILAIPAPIAADSKTDKDWTPQVGNVVTLSDSYTLWTIAKLGKQGSCILWRKFEIRHANTQFLRYEGPGSPDRVTDLARKTLGSLSDVLGEQAIADIFVELQQEAGNG